MLLKVSILVFKISGSMFCVCVYVCVFTKAVQTLKQHYCINYWINWAHTNRHTRVLHGHTIPFSFKYKTHTEHTAETLDFKAMYMANCVQPALWLWAL